MSDDEYGAAFIRGITIAFGHQEITVWFWPWKRRGWEWNDDRSTTRWIGFGVWLARDWYAVEEAARV